MAIIMRSVIAAARFESGISGPTVLLYVADIRKRVSLRFPDNTIENVYCMVPMFFKEAKIELRDLMSNISRSLTQLFKRKKVETTEHMEAFMLLQVSLNNSSSSVVSACYWDMDLETVLMLQKMLVVLFIVTVFWIIRYTCKFLNVEKQPVRVLVTGAAGKIGYTIVPMIARGMMLGPDQPVILHLLGTERSAQALEAINMELLDAAFPLLQEVIATTDVVEAFTGVNIAVMLAGHPRKEDMERKELMSKSVSIYKAHASALEKHADKNCKVLVVANPANTNALILKEFAPSIPEKNITCLTRLDHSRSLGQISDRLDVPIRDVKNVIIWGNHSSNQYPDVNHAIVKTKKGEKPVRELVADDQWLKNEFITTVQQRGAAILTARKQSSALSAAKAACDHIRDWVLGTPKGTWISMGVHSDGSYGIEPGLIYSFPVTCDKGNWTIVQGLKIDEFSRAKLDATAKELKEEKEIAYSCLNLT